MIKNRLNIPMCMACLLLVLVVLTTNMSGGLFAKYRTSSSGGDTARVAKFEVDANIQSLTHDLTLDIRPGESNFMISLENKSEVAIDCLIEVKNITKNIPLVFEVINGSNILAGETRDVTFKVKWDENGALDYMGMVDLVKIYITVQQVD